MKKNGNSQKKEGQRMSRKLRRKELRSSATVKIKPQQPKDKKVTLAFRLQVGSQYKATYS